MKEEQESRHDWLLKYRSFCALVEIRQKSSHEMWRSGSSIVAGNLRAADKSSGILFDKGFDAITRLCYDQLFLTMVAPP
jgi:hypothetical protein